MCAYKVVIVGVLFQCYLMVFTGTFACVGPWTAFQRFGIPFMIDVDGQFLPMKSEDKILTSYAQLAISRYYPMIIGNWFNFLELSL